MSATKPDILAPGVNITAASHIGSGYVSMSGTSMATPFAAGVMAIAAQAKPGIDPTELKDAGRYQTVYSKYLGSAAAPTAGLHFTKELLKRVEEKGVKIGFVTLHVGAGTFRPVKTENIIDHRMHEEYFELPEVTANLINQTKSPIINNLRNLNNKFFHLFF